MEGDKRFDAIAKDPKYRRVPKSQSKFKIDKRFHSMFTDKQFQVKYSSDKRGRPVKLHSNDDLKKYYDVSSDGESDTSEDDDDVELKDIEAAKSDNKDSKLSVEDSSIAKPSKKDKKLPDGVKTKLRDMSIDYARGEKQLLSESSSDDEESDEEISEGDVIDHRWGELDADAGQTEEATYRLAACNLDWDRIRAVDLLVLLNSFLPPAGSITSVAIYPSEFGKQRLKEEEVMGPIELVKKDNQIQLDEDDENEEGSKYHMEKLRQYQLNRLKYYYAVITFDSASSANKIYTECDGMEYESSATKMDLRFIPDDMTFDDEPKEVCDEIPDRYEPRFFTTTALQQAKVELTWDETDPDRLEFTDKLNKGKLDKITEKDFKSFLAVSSDEEEDSDKDNSENESDSERLQSVNNVDKYKALLEEIQDKEKEKGNKDFEMEISWETGLKEKTDKLMKEKRENSDDKTPFQKYLEKRKEKRKERKQMKKNSKEQSVDDDSDVPSDVDMNDPYFAEEFDNPEFKKPTTSSKKKMKQGDAKAETDEDKHNQAELDLLLMNESDSKNHFNLKKIQESEIKMKGKKKKNKKVEEKQEDGFEINVKDNRFSALFTSHHFNIDPTDPHFKKTKATDRLIQEKIKRRNEGVQEEDVKKPKKDVELNVLVKNVKRKAQAFKKK